MLGIGLFNWIKLGGAVALVIAAWFALHSYNENRREEGRAELRPKVVAAEKARDVFRAQLETCSGANAKLADDLRKVEGAYAEQAAKMRALGLAEKAALAEREATMAKLRAKEQTLKVEIERLTAIINGPPAENFVEGCREADRILDDLAARRLRVQ